MSAPFDFSDMGAFNACEKRQRFLGQIPLHSRCANGGVEGLGRTAFEGFTASGSPPFNRTLPLRAKLP